MPVAVIRLILISGVHDNNQGSCLMNSDIPKIRHIQISLSDNEYKALKHQIIKVSQNTIKDTFTAFAKQIVAGKIIVRKQVNVKIKE